MIKYLVSLLPLIIIGCTATNEDPYTIINDAIEAAGVDQLENAEVKFRFRGRDYGFKNKAGDFEMVRLWKDSTGLVRDEVTNNGFQRQINGESIPVLDSMAVKYTNSINSVIYFALLPYKLNDAAVVKTYLSSEQINNNNYHKVAVAFREEGGGEDFQDNFIYWINQDTNFIDYLAYDYATEGGGQRFRVAYNPRTINGLRVVDYINFKPKTTTTLSKIAESFQEGALEEISRIELEDVKVELL